MSLVDLCRASLSMEGRTVPHQRDDMIRAAVSASEWSMLLSDSANKILEMAHKDAPATWRSWCAVRSANDFKEHTSLRPTFAGELLEVGPDGEIKHGSLQEKTFKWRISTFAKMYKISRQQIINDDLNVLSDLVPGLARTALKTLGNLIYRTLLLNAGTFFSVANKNLVAGALSVESLSEAIELLYMQTDAEGNNLDLVPATLVVPPQLAMTARALIESTEVARAVSTEDGIDNQPTGNPMRGVVKLEIEPRLSNLDFPGSSATQWYLFA